MACEGDGGRVIKGRREAKGYQETNRGRQKQRQKGEILTTERDRDVQNTD